MRTEEAAYFDEVTGHATSIVIPHIEKSRFIDRNFTKVEKVGVVASANRINLAVVTDLVRTLAGREEREPLPFVLHIAGQMKDLVQTLPPADLKLFDRPWIRLLGFVPDIETFYQAMDVVVSPVTMGTGINVKTVQAMAFGMPLLSTAWGSKGIETNEPLHRHDDLASLCDSLMDLCRDPSRLNHLAAASRATYEKFHDEALVSIDLLMKRVKP
jgi:glycosyltransferase involved in cell wall biosynthesis